MHGMKPSWSTHHDEIFWLRPWTSQFHFVSRFGISMEFWARRVGLSIFIDHHGPTKAYIDMKHDELPWILIANWPPTDSRLGNLYQIWNQHKILSTAVWVSIFISLVLIQNERKLTPSLVWPENFHFTDNFHGNERINCYRVKVGVGCKKFYYWGNSWFGYMHPPFLDLPSGPRENRVW